MTMKSFLKKRREKIIHKAATGKHNEKTVALCDYQLRLSTFYPGCTELFNKMSKSLQTPIKIDWPGLKNPSVVFSVKAMTERHGNDVNNWETADKVVLAKAHAKACAIAQKIYIELWNKLKSLMEEAEDVGIMLNYHELRERDFVKNV